MISSWSKANLAELLRLERRPVNVDPTAHYQEIGIYCFGRGIFHKEPRSGLEVGDKNLFLLKEGDFILQVTFAWEGAIAVVSAAEDGMYGSTRYPTFRVDESRCVPKFLLNYFQTREGLQQLVGICPGSAGRNRVLNLKRLSEVHVPLPSVTEQRRIVERVEELTAQINEARILRQKADEESRLIMDRATAAHIDAPTWGHKPLGEILAEPPRNGLSPKPETESGGRPMLRINAVSSSPTKFVDITASKTVAVTDKEASPFELKNDDVFIVRYNGDINRVAKPAIFKGDQTCRVVFPDKLMRLRARPEMMTPDFLVFALRARSVREQIEQLGKTTAGNIGISA